MNIIAQQKFFPKFTDKALNSNFEFDPHRGTNTILAVDIMEECTY